MERHKIAHHTPIKNTHNERARVVIIGGGFAGLQAARQLGKVSAQVTIIDRTNHHLFQPLLYQVATAALSPGEISIPIRYVLRHQDTAHVLMAEVTDIDTQQQRVITHDQEIPYDYLIIATGAHVNYFGHDEWRTHAPALKSIEDARAIRQKILLAFEQAEQERDPQRIAELLTFVIVGGGPTGVELAGDIAELSRKVLQPEFQHIDPALARIILVEAGPHILAAYPETLSQSARKQLERLGVEVRTGMAVTNINENGAHIGDEFIAAHTVIWTAGVSASPAAQWLGAAADRAGRVKVETDLSVPGLPNVFVVGDTAAILQDGKPVPGVAPAAMQQGQYVGKLLARRLSGKEQRHPVKPFRYWDKGTLATIGRASAIGQIGWLHLSGFPAWFMWMAIQTPYSNV